MRMVAPSSAFPVALGDAVQIEVDISDDDDAPPDLTWVDASISIIDIEKGEFDVLVTEWSLLPPDDPDFEEPYVDGPYLASFEGLYVDGFTGRWRRAPTASDSSTTVAIAPSAQAAAPPSSPPASPPPTDAVKVTIRKKGGKSK